LGTAGVAVVVVTFASSTARLSLTGLLTKRREQVMQERMQRVQHVGGAVACGRSAIVVVRVLAWRG
jgi:hypothetical protein